MLYLNKDKKDQQEYLKNLLSTIAEEDRENSPQLYDYPTFEQIDDNQKQQGHKNENNNDMFNYKHYSINWNSKDDAGYAKFDD